MILSKSQRNEKLLSVLEDIVILVHIHIEHLRKVYGHELAWICRILFEAAFAVAIGFSGLYFSETRTLINYMTRSDYSL